MKVTESDNLKHRQLRNEDYLQMVSAEQKEYAEVCESPKMTETDNTNTKKQREGLLEQILSRENLNRAYKQVKRNKGAGGIDICSRRHITWRLVYCLSQGLYGRRKGQEGHS
jgi:RNA-directed DNA polymerase